MATLLEVQQLLNDNNVKYDSSSQYYLDQLTQYSYESLRAFIENCSFVHNELYSVAQAITVQNVYSIISKAKLDLLKGIKNEFNKIVKSTNLDDKSALTALRVISDGILDISDRTDQEISIICGQYFYNIENIKSISNSFTSYLPQEIATKIYSNCIERMQTFAVKSNPEEIKSVIYYCLNSLGENSLSANDMLKISKKCATFYADTTYEKISTITQKLQYFQQYILEKIRTSKTESNADYVQKVKAKDLHSILMNTPSLFATTPSTIAFNIDFIKGNKNLGELIKEYRIPTSKGDFEKLKNISASFELNDLASIYSNNLSLLTLSPEAMLKSIQLIDNTSHRIFGQDILPEEYITSKNFTQLSQIYQIAKSNNTQVLSQWADNLQVLSGILDKAQLKQYFLSNFKLATIPTEHLSSQISNTILQSDPAQLSNNLGTLLQNNFNWDSDNAHVKEPSRMDNSKTDLNIPIELTQEMATRFLENNGLSPKIIENWINKAENSSFTSVTIENIKELNEISKRIDNLNKVLDNSQIIPITLFSIRNAMKSMKNKIEINCANTQQPNISNFYQSLKNDFDALAQKYNRTITSNLQDLQDQYNELNIKYNQYQTQINEQYADYVSYHSQTPEIMARRAELIRKQTEITSTIKKLQDQQDLNRKKNLSPIAGISEDVYKHFDAICSKVIDYTNQTIIKENPAQSTAKDDSQILNDNLQYLYDSIHYKSNNYLPGQIFVSLRTLRDSKFSNIYNTIFLALKDEYVDIDAQLSHTQPENFHGDAISNKYIVNWLGENYSDFNFNLIKGYNKILRSGNNTYYNLTEKIKGNEATLNFIKEELALLDAQIENGYSNKKDANRNSELLGKIWEDKKDIDDKIKGLEALMWE